jgi:transglutaminase-like putative cysteine protease
VIDCYDLSAVAGNGPYLHRGVRLMNWLRDNTTYDGGTQTHPDYNCRDLLSYGYRHLEKGLNCRMLATVLAELLLGLGLCARIVALHSPSRFDADNHVVTIVWLPDLKERVMLDPSFKAYLEDPADTPLSPWELRSALADGISVGANIGAPVGDDLDRERSLLQYYAKNLFCMQSPETSTFGSETELVPNQRLVTLCPVGFDCRASELLSLQWRADASASAEVREMVLVRRNQVDQGAFVFSCSVRAFGADPGAALT